MARRLSVLFLALSALGVLLGSFPVRTSASGKRLVTYRLPWQGGETWYFVGGPHPNFTNFVPQTALDFAPPVVVPCGSPWLSLYWATAVEDGRIVIVETNKVEIEHPDGSRTGYFHLATGSIQVILGQFISQGDRLGNPSCDGGDAWAPHVHLFFKQGGVEIPADGQVLSGWTVHAVGPTSPYQGTMTKFGEYTRTAITSRCPTFAPCRQGVVNDLTNN